MNTIVTLPQTTWKPQFNSAEHHQLTHALESGQVLHFPSLAFVLSETEKTWMTAKTEGMQAKNISFNSKTRNIRGIECDTATRLMLQQLCQRFHQQALDLINHLFPLYERHLQIGMTSFRPVEVAGRIPASYKKDDTRLHVDAFPSRPNQGRRILRVFSNINPYGKPRVWRVGEPFQTVAERFFPQVPAQFPGSALLLNALGITKSYRTRYDHSMLHIHDKMKADVNYQREVKFEEIAFMAGATWVTFSDSVSHAVLSGQHMMEQTFYLAAQDMQNPELSPLYILERLAGKALV